MRNRAYALLDVKAIDEEQRIIEGIATTPETDRMGDVVEPKGAEFQLPIPLLWQHDSRQPIGEVFVAKVTSAGIEIKARIARIDEPGALKTRLDEAWQSIKNKLVRGLSIGFQSIGQPERIEGTFGLRFVKWLWLELSAVTIPANGDASITAIKSLDQSVRAASGAQADSQQVQAAGVSATPVAITRRERTVKTLIEQIQSFEATRQAKDAERTALMTAASDKGETLDAAGAEQYDSLAAEIKSIDEHIVRLRELEQSNKSAAKPANGDNTQAAAVSRQHSAVQVKDNVPAAMGMTRFVIARVASRLEGATALEIAKARWPNHTAVHTALQAKATIPGALTTDSNWAGNLVYATNLESEFLEFLRPQTIIGRIPGLRRVPFNVRIAGQATGSVANWVGQGKPKPVTSFSTTATTLGFTKIAAIAVLTEESVRFSSPSLESLVRDELSRAVIERMDVDFIDPAHTAVSNVNPASITNGLSALSSAGTSADNVRTDIINLLGDFINNNVNPNGLVLVMPNLLAMALSVLTNSLGQREFPEMTMNGGTLLGIPVITSQYAANQSGAGNLVIAINAGDVALAADDSVRVDASGEASIQMSDAPTNDASTGTGQSLVSMYQTNSIAVRAERFINWAKLRTGAVVYMDDVNWGSVGSPS